MAEGEGISEIARKITPTQWVLIAGAGLGLGLLLRLRHKAQATTTTPQGFDTSQYSGTGQTGYVQGNAFTPTPQYDPNQVSNPPPTPVPVTVPSTDTGGFGSVTTPPSPPTYPPNATWDPLKMGFTTPDVSAPIAQPVSAPVAPTVMTQGMYLGAFLPQNVAAFTAPGGYLDKFFSNPNQYQIIGGTGTPATTSQVLADLQARGIPINPNWKAIN